MRAIIHISDLHFGRTHAPTLQPLVAAVRALKPDLVAVSGDLTDKARTRQFVEARRFLAALPGPQIVVPGNHDVPRLNLVARLLRPFERFRRHITPDLNPSFADDEIAVVGANTARLRRDRQMNPRDAERVCVAFASLGEGARRRIVVTHRPFDLKRFSGCGADLFLAGSMRTDRRLQARAIATDDALVIQAGTATAAKGGDRRNGFNLVLVGNDTVTVETHAWQPGRNLFARANSRSWKQAAGSWVVAGA